MYYIAAYKDETDQSTVITVLPIKYYLSIIMW